jgi:hypothetical protein
VVKAYEQRSYHNIIQPDDDRIGVPKGGTFLELFYRLTGSAQTKAARRPRCRKAETSYGCFVEQTHARR